MWRNAYEKGRVGISVDSDGDNNLTIISHIDNPEQFGTTCAEVAAAPPPQVAFIVLETWLCS